MENLLLNIIDDYLKIEEGEEESWSIKNDSQADWALDKIKENIIAHNRFKLVINDKIQQLQFRLKEESEKLERENSFFESKLREYFEKIERFAKETKTQKSYKLPSGTLKLTKIKESFDYDKTKLIDYAKANDMADYIKISEDFKWGDFKKQLTIKDGNIINKETGELIEIDGLGIDVKPEEFKIEI